jgi:hypothetical protein
VRKNKIVIITERGLNKAVIPVRKMKGKEIRFPFTWTVQKDGNVFECSLSNYWGTGNFMLMDVLTNCYRTLNADKVEKREPIFTKFNPPEYVNPEPIQFTTEDFRRLTSQKNLFRKEITKLILETANVKFKLLYPVLYLEKITTGRNKGEQKVKQGVQPFTNSHTIFKVEIEGDRYVVTFDTLVGKIFCHNIQLKGFNQLPDNFYDLPKPAQLVYRRFISHIYKAHPIKLHIENITSFLNLEIKDGSMMKHNIQKNILEPLKKNEPPLISSYEYHDLFNERFYNIKI